MFSNLLTICIAGKKKIFFTFPQKLLECVSIMETLIKNFKCDSQTETDTVTVEHLMAMCKVTCLKIKYVDRVFQLTLSCGQGFYIRFSFCTIQGSYRLWNSGKNYGILKRKFHIWKNYGIWAKRPYIWKNYGIFVLVEKVRAFFKKCGKNTSGLGNLVLMFVALVIISLGLALRTFRAIPLAYCSAEWIPARQLTLFFP